MAVGIDKGKAYVYGYEIEKLGTTYVNVEKARQKTSFSDVVISPSYGNYVLVKNIHALPNVNNLETVELWSRYTTTPGAVASGAIKVGTARIRSIKWDSGDTSGPNAVYKLFLFDINMSNIETTSTKYNFNSSVKQIVIPGPAQNNTFTADISIVPIIVQGSLLIS